MRVLLQRVSEASVAIEGAEKSRIGQGMLLLLGIERDLDVGGEALLVSQFTLHARVKKGTRPSFERAARPAEAIPLYERFAKGMEEGLGRPVATGEFGAMMEVSLVNDGPVTIWIDSKNRE
jgi:D-tyrosyl-tRNA(Tyr) deacylase